MSRPRRRIQVLVALVAVAGLAAACGDDDDAADDTTTSEPSSSVTSSSTTAPGGGDAGDDGDTGTGAPCTEDRANRVDEDDRQAVGDVDGDGQDDEAWIAVGDEGATTVGIDTAAGGSASRLWESASPVTRQALVVDTDGEGPVEILASDGRAVELWAFVDCAIEPVRNAQGATYTFSLGFADVGTGVGCVEVDGGRELVGLDVVADEDDTVTWARTVVELDGLDARNGERTTGTFTRPADAAAIDLLHEVTCGDRTMGADGLQGA